MQVVDVNGNMFGYDHLEIIGIDGKPKTIGGGGSAVWGGITGTLSAQTDLQSALNSKENTITPGTTSQYWRGDKTWQPFPSLTGFVPYTGATTNVDLGTHTLSAKDLIINHPSGSGVAVSITKGGSGEALTVVKTSGSGNAMSVTGGVTQLDELYLTTDLADSYISSAATWNAKQNAITLTTTGSSGPATLVGATLNIRQYSGGGGASDFKFKAISSTQGTIVTGINGVAISSSVFIPSGTLTANDNIIDLLWAGRRQSGAGVVQAQLYLNTTNSLTGAKLMGIGLNYTSNNWNGKHLRTLFQNGNTLVTNQNPVSLSNTDYSTPATPSTYAYNPLTDNLYIIFAMNNLSVDNISYTNGHKVLCY